MKRRRVGRPSEHQYVDVMMLMPPSAIDQHVASAQAATTAATLPETTAAAAATTAAATTAAAEPAVTITKVENGNGCALAAIAQRIITQDLHRDVVVASDGTLPPPPIVTVSNSFVSPHRSSRKFELAMQRSAERIASAANTGNVSADSATHLLNDDITLSATTLHAVADELRRQRTVSSTSAAAAMVQPLMAALVVPAAAADTTAANSSGSVNANLVSRVELDPLNVGDRIDGVAYWYRGEVTPRIWCARTQTWLCVAHRKSVYFCRQCLHLYPRETTGGVVEVRSYSRQTCQHGRRADMCVDCGGKNICPHRHLRFQCCVCAAELLQRRKCLAHGRRKYTCSLCKQQQQQQPS